MNKRTISHLIGILFSTSPLIAFAADALKTDDIIVTANRINESLESTLRDVSVIDREQIERAGQSTLVEILQSQPGIEVNNNGGVGKASGIFMRGTNTTHVLVLVDGVRLNSATLGTTTFENLPVALIEKIEILRGPAASLYGQDAIGGVIQIFTKKGGGALKYYAGIGYGKYDTKTAEAGVHGSAGDTGFALGVSSKTTDGFSAYKTSNQNLDDNDSYRNLSFTGSLTHKIAEGHDLAFQFLSSEGHARFDNRFNLFNLPPDRTDFSDNVDISQLSYAISSKNQWLENWLSTLRFGEGVDEAVSFQSFGRSLFRTKQRQLTWQNELNLPVGKLTLAYDRLEERVSSTTQFKQTSRNNDGYYAGYLANLGNHTMQFNYRSDHSSRFGHNDTGGVAYGYQLNGAWRATASYGSAFKAPSFNDLFFPDFFGSPSSNPNLLPEKSDNIEASVRFNQADTSASVTVYENKIRNLIALDADFIPFNAAKAEIKGITLAASQGLGNWNVQGSVDIQSPRIEETGNLLVRRANRHARANVSYNMGDWRFGAEIVASSKRYNDAANTLPIAGYSLFNLTADYQINQDWKAQARLNNVFDKNYVLAFEGNPSTSGFAYDTPGTDLFVSVRWQPK